MLFASVMKLDAGNPVWCASASRYTAASSARCRRFRRMRASVSLARVIASCDRFEADWNAGRARRIENELAAADEPIRTRLFRELLALKLELTRRDGRPTDLDAYLARFPDRPDTVREVFSDTLAPSHREVTVPVMREEPIPSPEGYDIIRKLGKGGQATTYLARDRGLALCEQGEADLGLLWLARALEIGPEDDPELAEGLQARRAGVEHFLIAVKRE